MAVVNVSIVDDGHKPFISVVRGFFDYHLSVFFEKEFFTLGSFESEIVTLDVVSGCAF